MHSANRSISLMVRTISFNSSCCFDSLSLSGKYIHTAGTTTKFAPALASAQLHSTGIHLHKKTLLKHHKIAGFSSKNHLEKYSVSIISLNFKNYLNSKYMYTWFCSLQHNLVFCVVKVKTHKIEI